MRIHKHVYNKNEGAGPWWKTAQWRISYTRNDEYHGGVMKGWWYLGTNSINRSFELEFAVGGEDNMVQLALVVPFLMRFAIGVRVPRSWTCGWVYQRRSWMIRSGYVGRWLDLRFAFDEEMTDSTRRYYQDRYERGERARLTRAQAWSGWEWNGRIDVRDRLLGRMEYAVEYGVPSEVVVPMPEGNYPAVVTPTTRTWKRPRWPWPHKVRRETELKMTVGVPVPGKGENSWDIYDDAILGVDGVTPSDAIANVVRSALKARRNYASESWVPDDGWPEGIEARA